jgi:4-hydroxybenzoate polyprenyltransferase
MRPKQWPKNALLFAGLLFTQDRAHPISDYLHALGAFFIFCVLSGLTYYSNDLLDINADQQHPTKRFRPIASGRLKAKTAKWMVALGLPILFFLTFRFFSLKFFLAAGCYLTGTLLYSFWLKHVVIVDVLLVAGLFVIRAAAGAFAIDVLTSEWLLLCTLFLALFLGIAKRRGELVALGEQTKTRKILAEYSLPLLDQMLSIIAAACIIAYSLYAFFSRSNIGLPRPYLMITIPCVIYGIFRYLFLMHQKGMGEAPESVLAEDRPMQLNLILWALLALLVLRLGPYLAR